MTDPALQVASRPPMGKIAPARQCEAIAYVDVRGAPRSTPPDAVVRCCRAQHPPEQEHVGGLPVPGDSGGLAMLWQRWTLVPANERPAP